MNYLNSISNFFYTGFGNLFYAVPAKKPGSQTATIAEVAQGALTHETPLPPPLHQHKVVKGPLHPSHEKILQQEKSLIDLVNDHQNTENIIREIDFYWKPSESFIESVNLLGPEEQSTLVLGLAKYHLGSLMPIIDKISIEDSLARLNIAQWIYGKENPYQPSLEYLPKLHLKEEECINILEQAVMFPTNDVGKCLSLFPFLDPNTKGKLARLDAQYNRSFSIAPYGIEDPDERLEFANLAAVNLKAGWYSRYDIRQFTIEDPKERLRLAKIVCTKDWSFFQKNTDALNQFNLPKEEYLEFLIFAAEKIPNELEKAMELLNPLSDKERVQVLCLMPTLHFQQLDRLSVEDQLTIVDTVVGHHPESLQKGVEELLSSELPTNKVYDILVNGATHFLKSQVDPSNASEEEIKRLVKHILRFRDPNLKVNYIKYLLHASKPDLNSIFKKIGKRSESVQLIAMGLFSSLPLEDIPNEICEKIMNSVNSNKSFKDAIHLREFLTYLQSLLHYTRLSKSEKLNAVKLILEIHKNQPKQNLKTTTQQLTVLQGIDRPDIIRDAISSDGAFDMREAFQGLLVTMGFSASETQDSWPLLEKLFPQDPVAPMIYWNTLSQLPDHEKALKAFKEFISEVRDGTFQQKRYELESSPHLQQVFGKDPQRRELWKKNLTFSFQSLVGTPSSSATSWNGEKFASWLREKIFTDDHLPALKESENFAVYCLHPNRSDELGTKMLTRLKLKENLTPLEQLECLCIQLCMDSTPDATRVKLLTEILNLPKANELFGQFFVDITTLRNQLSFTTGKTDYSQLICKESDDYQKLFLMGNVTSSCQRTSGNGSLNKGLLGIANGRNKLISVEERGKDIARAICRVLWDPVREEQVLILERIYNSRPTEPLIDQAIHRLAEIKAEELGLYLVTVEREGRQLARYPGQAVFGPDRAPFEYSDSTRYMHEGSETYTLDKLHILYTPSKEVPLPPEPPDIWEG